MKKLQFFFLFSFIFFLSQNIYPQFGFDKQLVTIESFKSFDKIQKGGEIKIAVKAKIEETWHINSHKPNEEFLIPTVLEIPNDFGITIIAEKYPDAKNIRFEFSDQPVAVYEGEILLGAMLNWEIMI